MGELRDEAARLRAVALELRRESQALRGDATQAVRRFKVAVLEIRADQAGRSLDRFCVTLAAWNGIAPTEKELAQWITGIETNLAEIESGFTALKGGAP